VSVATKDKLGDRIKSYEASETERRAMPGLPIVVRVDGRGFSKFTKGMARPFDVQFADLMVEVTKFLVEQTNAAVGYTQSDEITLVMDPFVKKARGSLRGEIDPLMDGLADADFLFSGRWQKLTSVIAGMASTRFVMGAMGIWPDRVRRQPPVFDCRVFQVPTREEAVAALVWRELDATKNAVSMAARAHFSHSDLQNKSSAEMQEMLFRQKSVNFNDYPPRFKRGVYVQRRSFERRLDPEILAKIPEHRRPTGLVVRNETVVLELPKIKTISNRVEVLLDGADPLMPD
jgi:tRNA(His) guanylyltransferase